jgi:phenylpropionate dioxygenase-like ring-hydroxylating dioxygenase large terminal subunit
MDTHATESKELKNRPRNSPYSAYYHREVPKPDEEITQAGPGTPLGEYMRRFWQPVCLSSQLKDVPHKIRIMNEDLIAFRDKGGRVGVMQKHCCHRGASLEYGVIQTSGIRCCYHGLNFDIDGSILDAPNEPDKGAKLKQTLSQGAYPAFERDGLVFAYMGPPDEKPPFPEWDAFDKHGDTRLLPFSNVFPCNWLQVLDNISDQIHTATLHNPALLYEFDPPKDLVDKLPEFTLAGFATMPVMDYMDHRNGTAMAFIAGRRTSDNLVWWRMNECVLPNNTWHAYLFENGSERRPFHRIHMARWYVPVDDKNSIIYGWRMFGNDIDPFQKGREHRVGWDDNDFLGGQVGNRPYEESQRLPGDYDAVVSQRAVAVHALENPTSIDIGVYMFRKHLRNAIRGKNPHATPDAMHSRARAGLPSHTYTQNTVLSIPRQETDEADRKLIGEIGRQLSKLAGEADAYVGEERRKFVLARMEEIERRHARK